MPVPLSPTEFTILSALAARPGQAVSKRELAEAVWGQYDTAIDSAIHVNVHRLRGKLTFARPGRPAITPVRGFGYRLDA